MYYEKFYRSYIQFTSNFCHLIIKFSPDPYPWYYILLLSQCVGMKFLCEMHRSHSEDGGSQDILDIKSRWTSLLYAWYTTGRFDSYNNIKPERKKLVKLMGTHPWYGTGMHVPPYKLRTLMRIVDRNKQVKNIHWCDNHADERLRQTYDNEYFWNVWIVKGQRY